MTTINGFVANPDHYRVNVNRSLESIGCHGDSGGYSSSVISSDEGNNGCHCDSSGDSTSVSSSD